jgi:ubiquinone/menaquinone biosynthesis C-methylase UbiE
MDNKALVQSQFGTYAANYVASQSHAKGESLARLVELAKPQKAWRVLDIATGAGHTALAFAPHVAHVTASDLTPQMLEQAALLAKKRGIDNIAFERAEAERLPFPDATFDLVTCRLAPHHFDDIAGFLAQVARVLKPHGLFALVDNVSPEGEADAPYNAFEKLRDPSHGRCLTMDEWKSAVTAAGLRVRSAECLDKPMNFEAWTDQMAVSAADKARLREMLAASPALAQFLRPDGAGAAQTFMLVEGLFVAEKV